MTTEEMVKKYKPKNKLEKEVLEIIEDKAADYEDISDWFNSLFEIGVSGMVSQLVSYSDTLDFTKRHSTDINNLLSEKLEETGIETPKELFSKWDTRDNLCLNTKNLNLLALFAFEDISLKIVRSLNFEDGEI